MKFNYVVVPDMVKKIWYVAHKGKMRGTPPHKHKHSPDCLEFIYVDYGSAKLCIKDSTFVLEPGECILFQGKRLHSLEGAADGVPIDYLNSIFLGQVPPEMINKKIKVNPRILYLIEGLRQESITPRVCRNQMIHGLLLALLSELMRQITEAIPKHIPESPVLMKYPSAYVNRALKIIAEDYRKPLTLHQVSQASRIGYSQLCKQLKKETGESFCMILHRHRVAAAKHLLREGNLSIQEIVDTVGYSYTSFFFKIFKRISGMTPYEYLRSLGEPQQFFNNP
jgi:AraC-like DNA-binding protein